MAKKITQTALAKVILKSQKSRQRKANDFYPTPADVTRALLDVLDLPAGSLVREPACGGGAISRVLIDYGYRVQSSDLCNRGYGQTGVDFLYARAIQSDAIITNPPFKLAGDFIRKAVLEAPVVAMLLKSNYWHAARRVELFMQHPPSAVYALTWRPAFLEAERGKNPLMDCCWTVWTGSNEPTRYRLLQRPQPLLVDRLTRLGDAVDYMLDEL